MRLPQQLVELPDCQQNWERVQAHGLFDDTVNSGIATLNFPTAQAATTLTVSHGLSGTPTSVVASLQQSPGTTMFTAWTTNYTNTTFDLNAEASVATTGNKTFSWVAVL